MTTLLQSEMYFSYHQFMVLDASLSAEAGLLWTDDHHRQGFARRDSIVSFSTLVQHGDAAVTVFLGPYSEDERFTRVVAVPFSSPTGTVEIAGPEEGQTDRNVRIDPGEYRLVVAQTVLGKRGNYNESDLLRIELFFQRLTTPLQSSQILVADPSLNPPEVLVEDAEMALP